MKSAISGIKSAFSAIRTSASSYELRSNNMIENNKFASLARAGFQLMATL
ncbi:MAG: hypothetical protein I8H71_07840 [Xanthomonadaceae bacterium]|nr:hypothetical protein [Xanthomonadaceae bacterium]